MPRVPLLLEHLDQTRECIFFQITAGEGKNKSPERAQRMRHVQRKGLEGLGGDDTGWTSWLETQNLNVPIHSGKQALLVVPGKLLTLKLKLKLSQKRGGRPAGAMQIRVREMETFLFWEVLYYPKFTAPVYL